MEARVKLVSDGAARTIELIRIEEIASETEGAGIALYVRQFSPELELRVSENLQLVSLEQSKAVFQNDSATKIRRLTYDCPDADTLLVEVMFPDEQAVTAELKRC